MWHRHSCLCWNSHDGKLEAFPAGGSGGSTDKSVCATSSSVCGGKHGEVTGWFYLISANSSSVNSIPAPPMFSSRCFTREVPGIGSITFDRFSSQDRKSVV